MRRIMIGLLIIVLTFVLSAKVIYDFFPERGQLPLKSQKTKSTESLQQHKENYFKLVEKLGLYYIVDWKSGVDKNGDTVKYFDNILYADKINLHKFKELQKLGLRYAGYEEMGFLEPVNRNVISQETLISYIFSKSLIFIGTVKSVESPFYSKECYTVDRLNTNIEVSVEEFIKGSYYFDELPNKYHVYCLYGYHPTTKELCTVEDWGETMLTVGSKYIFFVRQSNIYKDKDKDVVNNKNILENRNMGIYLIENNEINDKKWRYPDYINILKLSEYIKLIEKTNETENFYDIEF
ncbi:MAG: hypothetical protein L6407_09070 [Candidatus Delongbacteria bacterium]|nr:hypothetical protein [Candidatus Delongbacteria bacterium]